MTFSDPLHQEGKWISSISPSGGACQFTGRAYHVSQQPNDYFVACHAKGTFSNFAFEVQLTITQGDCGGMAFRDYDYSYYYFTFCENSSYVLYKYVNDIITQTLFSGHSIAIHTGQGHQNKMAVVADGSSMTFYVNEQQIHQVQDSGYAFGRIALVAE